MNTENKFKNSAVMNGRGILYLIENNIIGPRAHISYYFFLTRLIVGGVDFRSRTKDSDFFIGLPVHKINQGLHINKTFDAKLKDIMDERALGLIKQAKEQNKKIYVSWSGGIDSTAVLTSLLKNSDETFKENIEVVLSSHSILENIEFYKNHISNKLTCHSYNSFFIDEHFLKNNIFLCGDLADSIFNSFPFERTLGEDYPSLTDKKSIVDIINTKSNKNYGISDMGEWFFDLLEKNISESNTSFDLKTFNEYCWWINLNLKWNFESQRYLFFLKRRPWQTPLDLDVVSNYIKDVFFNTKEFQNWSYINLKNKNNQKDELKNYIFDFDKNFIYRNYKSKERGSPPNFKFRIYEHTPLLLGDDYCEIFSSNKELGDFLSTF